MATFSPAPNLTKDLGRLLLTAGVLVLLLTSAGTTRLLLTAVGTT
jgi:hypothetical protein